MGHPLAPRTQAPYGCASFLHSCSWIEGDDHPTTEGVSMENGMFLFPFSSSNAFEDSNKRPLTENGHKISIPSSFKDGSNWSLQVAEENGLSPDAVTVMAASGFCEQGLKAADIVFTEDMCQVGSPDQLSTLGNVSGETEAETERRKVQWNDGHGKELVQVYEFEPSDADDSEDEYEDGESQSCACAIQ